VKSTEDIYEPGQTDFIARQVSRVSRNLLLWNGAVLGLVVVSVFLLRTYLRGFLDGPQPADDAYVLSVAQQPFSGLIAYIDLGDRRLISTDYVEESSKNGKVYSTMSYYFVTVADKLLLVKAPPNLQFQKLVGPLQTISVKSDQQALDAIVHLNPHLRDRILPLMLNAASAYTVFGYVFFALIIPIATLCGYNICRAVLGSKTNLHPVMRSLKRKGDPEMVAPDIDAEMANDHIEKVGKVYLTRNWLLRPTIFGLIACRLDDIVWAFHMVISGDNVTSIAFRDGRLIGVPEHRNTSALLARISQRVPWAEKGWNKEKAKRWRTEQAAFLADVEARRAPRRRSNH
jgi:hypothetical protein